MRASIARRAIANGYEYLPDHHMSDPKVIQWVYAQVNLSKRDPVAYFCQHCGLGKNRQRRREAWPRWYRGWALFDGG